MMTVAVALNVPLLMPFHYEVPQHLMADIALGKRICVPFGKKERVGFVVAINPKNSPKKLKHVFSIVDTIPLLSPSMLRLAEWMARYYITALGPVLFCMVPRYVTPVAPDGAPDHDAEDRVVSPAHTLNAQQAKVFEHMSRYLAAQAFSVSLLWGITGSGKTEIYMRLIETCVANGYGVILMVPEIALTAQVSALFYARFGQQVMVLHSKMTAKARNHAWHAMQKGAAKVVIGPRSTLFAPIQHLGLIIVDEEHDAAYKQEETPRYHARDVAVVRAQFENVPILLGSATPSIESYFNAQTGKYHLLTLDKRATGAPLPSVSVAHMRYDPKVSFILSRQLFENMLETYRAGQQIILFINICYLR